MKQSNIYSSGQTMAMARKIMELQKYEVPFEVVIVQGISQDEKVAKLSWDQASLEAALENE